MGVTTAAVHPSDQTLSAYGLGKLDDASAGTVSKHLEDCDSCQRRVAELSSDEFLGRLQNAQVRSDKSAVDWSPSGVSPNEGARGPVVPPPPVDTLPPELVDHPDYEIVRELGRGGMGVVYLARNKLMGRLEVLKVVGGQLVERPGVRDRFLREVQSAAKLQHKNIVAAYSAMRLGESIVLAMEYIDGEDLARMVKSRGRLPVVHACYFIYQAALGLQHAHERGMVHRDIKPANLIFAVEGKKGVVKVLDFGLAKVTSEGQADSGLTREGQMLGTPDYIAPEQIRDAQSADIRADIYSLGCTLYYLLTGGPPFRGEHLWDLYQAHFSMDASPLNLVRPDVPVELAAVVAKMMAKEPSRRFQTPGEVAQALAPFFKTGSVGAPVSTVEASQVRQLDGRPESPAKGSVPTQPATNLEPTAASPVKKTAARARPEPQRESLIEFRETEPAKVPAPDVAVQKRPIPRWLLPAVAAGVLVVGLVVAWGVILRVKTANGMIELVNLPKDAEVFIDGEEVGVTWPGGGKPAVVTVTAGKHGVRAKKDGLETSGEEVTVRAGGKVRFTVRFLPLATSSEVEGKADDRPARPGVEKASVPPAGAGNAMTSPPPSPNSAADPAVHAMGVDADKPGKVEAEKPTGKGAAQIEDFVQLFNGRDLEGWKTHPKQPGNWRVENGLLIGSGPQASFLYSERGDYKDFHLRVEARINDGGNSGVCFRTPFGEVPTTYEGTHLPRQQRALRRVRPTAYEAQINSTHRDPNKTGSIYRVPGGCVAKVGQSPVPPGQWFWLEVTAEGRHIVVKVDGNTTADYWDENPLLTGGHIALQQQIPKTFVEFRKIEIKESNGTAGAMSGLPIGPAETVVGEPPAPAAAPSAKRAPATDSPKAAVNSIGMKLVLIPAGEFLMGSPEDDEDAEAEEKPRHRVQITRPFYLGVTEVTQGQYRAVMGKNPSHFKRSAELPVEGVSWFDAVKSCNKLSEREGRKPYYRIEGDEVTIAGGDGYRLPTEAEWEYACRAGTATRFSFGDDENALGQYAWYVENSNGRTHLVRRKQPNAFGLYDMHGNVYEWCWDGYDANHYKQSPAVDPHGPGVVAHRVIRGGSLEDGPQGARSALRHGSTPKNRDSNLGFRLARDPSGR